MLSLPKRNKRLCTVCTATGNTFSGMDVLDDIFSDDIIGGDIVIDSDKPAWDRLIERILRGDVIPVIGPDILCDGINLHDKLVEWISAKFGLTEKPNSISELVYNYDFIRQTKNEKDVIYMIMNKIFTKKFQPSGVLKELLSIRQFPFVITTSFTPVVEDVMREVWGEELRVMRFNNNPSENHDICGEADMRKPTVYYMFGKVGENAHRYVLTDTDMLAFCSSWLSDTNLRPGNLVAELKNKYLLMLGNSYADWLFRFVWYSMRKDNEGEGLYVYDVVEDGLPGFLERHHTFIRKNPREVVDKIKRMLEERMSENERNKFDRVEANTDVFISYSRSDSKIAEALYSELTARGKRVWYDRNDISYGGNFMAEIRNGIRSARYFVPIFTKHIEEERNEVHVYRNEWDEAMQVAVSLGRKYIIPVSEEGFDFYKASIPDRMQQHNAIVFDTVESIRSVADKIIHIMNQE